MKEKHKSWVLWICIGYGFRLDIGYHTQYLPKNPIIIGFLCLYQKLETNPYFLNHFICDSSPMSVNNILKKSPEQSPFNALKSVSLAIASNFCFICTISISHLDIIKQTHFVYNKNYFSLKSVYTLTDAQKYS